MGLCLYTVMYPHKDNNITLKFTAYTSCYSVKTNSQFTVKLIFYRNNIFKYLQNNYPEVMWSSNI